MARRFCQDCGTAAEPAAVFCAACGARLAAPPGSPAAPVTPAAVPEQASAPRRAASVGPASPWSPRRVATILGVASMVAVVALLGGALALDRLAPPGGSPGPPSAAGTPPAAIATAAPASDEPVDPTPPPTTAPSLEPPPSAGPAASPPYVAGDTPVEAVGAFLRVRGLSFAGLCSTADPLVDTGSYCTELVDAQPGTETHWIGLVGSEPDTWLLVEAGQLGWAVTEWEPVSDVAEEPPF